MRREDNLKPINCKSVSPLFSFTCVEDTIFIQFHPQGDILTIHEIPLEGMKYGQNNIHQSKWAIFYRGTKNIVVAL